MYVYVTGDRKVFKTKQAVEEYVKTPNMSMNIYDKKGNYVYYKRVKVTE